MARIDGARRPAAGELAAAEQKHRHGRRASRTARATRTAMLLGATVVLACHVGAATAQQPVVMHRQLMHSQLSGEQDNHYFGRRQANGTTGDTGIDVSISNTGIIPGGSSTTTALPSGGSSTTSLDPSSSSGSSSTSLDASASQSSTTEGDLSNTQTTTLPTSPTTTSIPPTTSTSDTTSATSATSQDVITTIITTTLDNGSIMTSASTASSTSAASNDSDDDESSNHKAWIIPLSVVAGIVALAGFLFLGYRCTQRRFSELDDDDSNAIRWPELMQRNGEEGTTLNPLATKRREGAGFDMDEDKSMSQLDLMGGEANLLARPSPSHAEVFANAGLGAPAMAMARTASSGGSSNGGSAADAGYYGAAPQHAYYDPYLGASSAPYPPPQRVMSPSQPQGYYDPYQDNPDYAPPSPYYPPPSRNAGSATGRSSPFQGGLPPAASPPIGVQPPTMSPHQQMHSPYGEHEDAYHPHLDPPMSPAAAVATAPRASPPIQQHKSMRLSIANPDGQGSE